MDTLFLKLHEIFDEIADFTLLELPKVAERQIAHKRDAADLVSNRDYMMEAKIIESIQRVFPNHSIHSEEAGVIVGENPEHHWLVDPIDGSCNDVHGIPWSCVSVAYAQSDQVIAGVVIHPGTGERFQAIRGQGATLNGEVIRLRKELQLPGSVVMTELLNQHPWPRMFDFVESMAKLDATVRVMGSTALAIAQVAAGRAAAAVFADAGALDVAAGVLIAEEAGAVVLKNGKPLDSLPKGRLTVAAPNVAGIIEKSINLV